MKNSAYPFNFKAPRTPQLWLIEHDLLQEESACPLAQDPGQHIADADALERPRARRSSRLARREGHRIGAPVSGYLPGRHNQPVLCIHELLNQSLADCVDLQIQCQQARWSMGAYGTPELSCQFGEISQAMALHGQELAVQIVELGGNAQGTLTEVCGRSGLSEYPTSRTDRETDVKSVIAALMIIRDSVVDEACVLAEVDDIRSAGILRVIARTTGYYLEALALYQARAGLIDELS